MSVRVNPDGYNTSVPAKILTADRVETRMGSHYGSGQGLLVGRRLRPRPDPSFRLARRSPTTRRWAKAASKTVPVVFSTDDTFDVGADWARRSRLATNRRSHLPAP